MQIKKLIAALIALGLGGPFAFASVVWDESVNGDAANISFSGGVTPTQLSVSAGNNQIIGSRTSSLMFSTDSDLFSFEIAEGFEIESIILSVTSVEYLGSNETWFEQVWNLLSVPDNGVLILSQATPFNEIATVTEVANTLGDYTLSQFNFSEALGSGIYVLAGISDTKSGDPRATVNYQWDIQVTSIPVPAAFWLFLMPVVGLLNLRGATNIWPRS